MWLLPGSLFKSFTLREATALLSWPMERPMWWETILSCQSPSKTEASGMNGSSCDHILHLLDLQINELLLTSCPQPSKKLWATTMQPGCSWVSETQKLRDNFWDNSLHLSLINMYYTKAKYPDIKWLHLNKTFKIGTFKEMESQLFGCQWLEGENGGQTLIRFLFQGWKCSKIR